MEIRPIKEYLSIFYAENLPFFKVIGMRFTKAAIKSIYIFSNSKAISGVVDPNMKVRFV